MEGLGEQLKVYQLGWVYQMGFCTVGNFGSDLRLDYTILGSPVNLAARLQSMAEIDDMLVDENTKNLISNEVETEFFKEFTPKGFVRPIGVYNVKKIKVS